MLPAIAIYVNYKLKLSVFTIEPNFIDSNNKFHFDISEELNEIVKNSYSNISIIYIDTNKQSYNFFFKSSLKYSRFNNLKVIKYGNQIDYIQNDKICLRYNNSDWKEIII